MNPKKIILAALLITLLAGTAYSQDVVIQKGDYWQTLCKCTCGAFGVNATGVYKATYGETAVLATANSVKLCHEQCARVCGGYTECSFNNKSDCADCCKNSFCTGYSDAIMSVPAKCELSCSSTCSYRGLVNGVVEIIYYVAGIIAVVMIVVNAIRLITSQDPVDRSSAKRGIIYVIIALIIIVLAATLVDVLMDSVKTPI